MTKTTARHRLPGDLDSEALVDRFIRVDHAGEFGAKRIYEGQLTVLGKSACGPTIQHMKDQEERHLETFKRLIVEHRVRPTALHPIWNLAGFALGVGTALLGPKGAMACTIAIEEVIDKHYAMQAEQLGQDDSELKATIEEFRAEELEHRDTAREYGGETAVGYPVLRRLIQSSSRAAIWLSERI